MTTSSVINIVFLREQCSYLNTIVDVYKLEDNRICLIKLVTLRYVDFGERKMSTFFETLHSKV